MGPNLLCVVGAFSFGWTGLATVLISNFGTSLAYGRAMRSLRVPADWTRLRRLPLPDRLEPR